MSKYFDWSEKKNRILKKKRNISFEEVVLSIANGQLLDILEHPDKEKYLGQKLLIVKMRNYAFVVPFIENEEAYFLKTIYPSRKATRTYLTDGDS